MSLSTSRKGKPSVTSFAKLLREHHSDLRQFLNVHELIPLLRKQELLTAEEWEEISGRQTRLQKIDQLIQILPQKGELAYPKFIDCLESEDEHLAHKELAVKLKDTQELWQPRSIHVCLPSAENDVTKTADLKETITIKLKEQITELLQSRLVEMDEMIHSLKERNASLEAQLMEKDKTIASLPQGRAEVTNFQWLLDYVDAGHSSQPLLHYNTQQLAKYYHDTRKVLKKVKVLLRKDNNRVNHYLEAASEDSDSMRSRASSMDSDWQLSNAFAKIKKPCSKQSIEEEKEPVEEENDNGHSEESSLSSADETDDESLNATQEQTGQEEQQLYQACTRALQNKQPRPISWPSSKKKRVSKTASNPLSSNGTPQVKRDYLMDGNSSEDKQVCVTVAEENEISLNEDTSIAGTGLDQSTTDDQEESSCTIFEGYLQKEGNSDIWRRRYFTLTKEFLFYSKSEQDSKPLGLIPLMDLALERKKKNSFEVMNKQTSLIKVKKPGKKHVQSYKVIKLKASSENEAAHWVRSIENAITTLRTQYPTPD